MLKRKEFILGAACGLLVAAGATAGGVISWPGAHAEAITASAGRPGAAFAPPQGAPLSVADIVQQVAPAVVQIEVETPVERQQGFQIPGMPGFVIPGPGGQQADPDAEPELTRGAGSGFFITADGFIVTNNHVVENATSISVVMADGRKLEAKLVGRDEGSDLAVIKVEGSDFGFVSFEEAAEPRVGDWVVAVGNPFGLGGTATAGIVSAKSRRDNSGQSSGYVDFIQIDAAINRGNSGGPTFDIYGRVIGVNSAIITPTGGSVGIGFAIPASVAKPITDRLMRGEAIERGFIGVGIRSLAPDQWEALGESRDFKGGLVESVTPDGPADKAGVEVGDFIVGVDGEEVENGTDITRQVGRAKPGDTIRLEIIREGRRQTLTLRSGTRPPESELNAQDEGTQTPFGQAPSTQGTVVEGLGVSAMTPALRERYNLPDNVNGLVVTRVTPGSRAAMMQFPAGAVISRANNRPVATPEQFSAEVATVRAAGRPAILLAVWTIQGPATVLLPLPKAE